MSRVKILRASAGSGKTYRLSFEYIRAVVENPGVYGSILAVTFTNKATAEMKRRILEQLHALSQGNSPYMSDLERETLLAREVIIANANRALGLILQDYSRFSVSTIDKFFQRVVRGFLKELDLDFNYSIELDPNAMLAQAVDRVVERSGEDPFLRDYLSKITMQRVEQGGAWDVREPLMEIGGELFQEHYREQQMPLEQTRQRFEAIKSDLEQRVQHMRQICGQALELMTQAGLEPSDFKQGKNSFAQYFAKVYRGTGSLVDRYNSYFSKAAADPAQCYKSDSPRREDIVALLPRLMPLIQRVEAMYQELEPDMVSLALICRMFDHYLLLSYIARELQEVWSEQGRIPLHQTNRLITKLVEGCDVPFIYEKMGNRYDRYMIDEFQDTSLGQWRNFEPLLIEAVSQTLSEAVMLIGDVKQAIYRWRGGDWSLLSGVAGRCFAQGDVDDQEHLATNWRSEPRVVEFNNMLIGGVVALDSQIMQEHLGAEYGASIELAYGDFAQCVPADRGDGGYVCVRDYDNQQGPGQQLIATVEDALSRGYSLGDIAVLVREKKHGVMVAQMLLEQGFSVVSSEALRLSESELVGFVVSVLALSVDRRDGVWRAIFNRFLDRPISEKIGDGELVLLRRMAQSSPIEALELVIDFFDLQSEIKLRGQVAYLQAFYQAMQDYCTSNVPDMAAFLRWWDGASTKLSIPMPESGGAISIMTIHKSKGLEFACVIIPFADWELLPSTSNWKKTVLWVRSSVEPWDGLPVLPVVYGPPMRQSHFLKDYLTESMYSHIDAVNMLYVGVTRAREELYIMYPTASEPKKMEAPSRISNLIAQVVGSDVFETGVKACHNRVDSSEVNQAQPTASQEDSAESDSIKLNDLPATTCESNALINISLNENSVTYSQVSSPHCACSSEMPAVTSTETSFDEIPATIEITNFPSHSAYLSIRTNWSSERYFEQRQALQGQSTSSPERQNGLLLHSILEKIKNIDQARPLLEKMQNQGLLNSSQILSLENAITQIQQNPTINAWFSAPWQVLNEKTILTPQGQSYRPDRVITQGSQATVIDYKFGNIKAATHKAQVTNYMTLLQKMSYTQITGFLWYVELGEIVSIDFQEH